MLNKVHLLDFNANRRYLLDKTQHTVGGFGKLPGDPPGKAIVFPCGVKRYTLTSDKTSFGLDILHSYLGLAALAIMKEPGLKSLDATLCMSVSAMEHLQTLDWRDVDDMAREGGSSVDPADDGGG